MTTHERQHTGCAERQLEHQGNPGQHPSVEVLRKHRPLEHPRPSAARVDALFVGELRFSSFVPERGFALVQVDRIGFNEQTTEE